MCIRDRAGVHLLAATGCDALVFGAETPDAALLLEIARVLNSAAYCAALKQQLAAGAVSYTHLCARACASALAWRAA